MDSFTSRTLLFFGWRNPFAATRIAQRTACALALAGCFGSAGARAESLSVPAAVARPGVPFAIADFDGDSHPDVASISAGQTNLASTEYWIQLQLSAAGRQSIRLIGPVGGLRIVARDVNGDEWLDLIVSTAWSDRPVAVYLNDGHGGFALAEPTSYPQAFGEAKTAWNSVFHLLIDTIGVPPQSRPGYCVESRRSAHFSLQAGAVTVFDVAAFFDSSLISSRDRAPPSAIPYV